MTEKEHMDDLRAARGLPPQTRENLMESVAAARCYIDRASGTTNVSSQKELELRAFMSIFHPDHELTNAAPCEFRNRFGCDQD